MLEKEGESKEILHSLNLKLEKGKMYAIVGYNGAGKSTLSSLIKRNLDPSSGQILINGDRSLTTIDPTEWKSLISSLEQKSVIWPGISLRDNLLLGATGTISDDQMWQALERVGIKDKVSDLDLIYGEGMELSGGQEQLIELARVILQKKPLVILDEGTNQLDAMKEANIINIMNQIKQEAIVIFISHRMTSSSKCDQIIVLDNGRIEAVGGHKELIVDQKTNLYQAMWKLQVENN
jgi:ABC-type multidrug transport system fused ATPase/permease subunit